MKKIQKIIETCHDCEYMKVFNGMTGGRTNASICMFSYLSEDENKAEPFLIDICENGSNEMPIPQNCPLEDYKETAK